MQQPEEELEGLEKLRGWGVYFNVLSGAALQHEGRKKKCFTSVADIVALQQCLIEHESNQFEIHYKYGASLIP